MVNYRSGITDVHKLRTTAALVSLSRAAADLANNACTDITRVNTAREQSKIDRSFFSIGNSESGGIVDIDLRSICEPPEMGPSAATQIHDGRMSSSASKILRTYLQVCLSIYPISYSIFISTLNKNLFPPPVYRNSLLFFYYNSK